MKLFKMSLIAATTALLLQGCGGDGSSGSSDDKTQNIDTNVVGMWVNRDNPDELLALTFLEDGSYIHMQVDADLESNTDDNGMEWGKYSVNKTTGKLTTETVLDQNGSRGLSDGLAVNVRVVNGALILEFDENKNGKIDTNESITFTKVKPNGLQGYWSLPASETTELVGLAFLDDKQYVQVQVNKSDSDGTPSGLEWGEYSFNGNSNVLLTTPKFDANGAAGLSDPGPYYAEINGANELVIMVDDDGDGEIDAETEAAVFTRGAAPQKEPDTPVDTSHLSGLWVMPMSDSNKTIGLSFLDDGTYLQYQIQGEAGDGVEWGKYSLKHDHRLVVKEILFDNNSNSGLSDDQLRYVRVSGNTLTLEVDENRDGKIGNNESYAFTKAKSENELGVWKSDANQPDSTLNQELVYMAFLDDNTLVYVEVDEKEPRDTLDGEGEAHSGMQWNAYTFRNGTLTVGNSFYNDLGSGDLSDWTYLMNMNVNGNKMNLITYEDAQKYQSGEKDSFWFTRQ